MVYEPTVTDLRPTMALLGSGEFEPWARDVYVHALRRHDHDDGTTLIVPTAIWQEGEEAFEAAGRERREYFASMGLRTLVAPIRDHEDAFRAEIVRMTHGASFIFFCGGHPEYLVEVLRDSPFWAAVLEARERGVVLGGCSAGTWMWGELVPDSSAEELADHGFFPGLQVLPKVVLAPHWNSLDTFIPGLQGHVLRHLPPDCALVGVDDRTAIVGDGETWLVLGEGAVLTVADDHRSFFRAGETFTPRRAAAV
jgi:cyanophycinase-like exopeptidase